MLKLIPPSLDYQDSYLAVMGKKAKTNSNISQDYSVVNLPDQIKRWEAFSKDKENGRSEYWLIVDDSTYIGSFQLRYKPSGSSPELSSHLAWIIDHPEYDTDQNKTSIFKLGLEKVKES